MRGLKMFLTNPAYSTKVIRKFQTYTNTCGGQRLSGMWSIQSGTATNENQKGLVWHQNSTFTAWWTRLVCLTFNYTFSSISACKHEPDASGAVAETLCEERLIMQLQIEIQCSDHMLQGDCKPSVSISLTHRLLSWTLENWSPASTTFRNLQQLTLSTRTIKYKTRLWSRVVQTS